MAEVRCPNGHRATLHHGRDEHGPYLRARCWECGADATYRQAADGSGEIVEEVENA